MTAQECFNAAAWQRAVAQDYSNKAVWFREHSKHYFAQAYEWGQKATFAFHAGDATAAQWYKAIADDYSRKSRDNARAADDYANRAHFVSVAAQGNQERGNWLQSCENVEDCKRFTRPPGWTDAQWFTFVSEANQSEVTAGAPAEINICPDGVFCAAIAGNWPCKEISNPRTKKEGAWPTRFAVIEITFKTRWCFRNGQVTKMYPANAYCKVTPYGLSRGWKCENPDGKKLMASSTGGNPEHAAWIYSFKIARYVPTPWGSQQVQEDRWCAGNQVSGSGAHRRHGKCSLQPW